LIASLFHLSGCKICHDMETFLLQILVQDFARIVKVPLDQYLVYKARWQAQHKKRLNKSEEGAESEE